jgi:hypothetical protein
MCVDVVNKKVKNIDVYPYLQQYHDAVVLTERSAGRIPRKDLQETFAILTTFGMTQSVWVNAILSP